MAFWGCIVTAAVGAWLRKTARAPSTLAVVLSMGIVAVSATPLSISVYQDYQRKFNIWWQSSDQIERFLETQTPIGIRQTDAEHWLRQRCVDAAATRTLMPPLKPAEPPGLSTGAANLEHEPGYVPSSIGWETKCVINRHRLPFPVEVTATYQFDLNHQLVNIDVSEFSESF